MDIFVEISPNDVYLRLMAVGISPELVAYGLQAVEISPILESPSEHFSKMNVKEKGMAQREESYLEVAHKERIS